jgi:hypothetical protein
MSNASVPLRCKCRRKAVTSLRCSRCSVPICPDCSKVAPVGMLCSQCGSPRNLPLYQVSTGNLAVGAAVCLGVASLGGWILVSASFGYFSLLLAFLLGLAVAETALRITGRKRGPKVEALAGISAGVGIVIGYMAQGYLPMGIMPIAGIAVGVISAVNRVRYV